MRKLVFITLTILVLSWVWNKYGYLVTNRDNYNKTQEVADTPLVFTSTEESDKELSFLNLPQGGAIRYYADDVPGARSLSAGPEGVVFVGTRGEGVVYALLDKNLDGRSDERFVVASGLNSPNGIVYHQGTLYVAEISRIIRFKNIDTTYQNKPAYEVVYDNLPKEGHHGWRYMALGPDDRLYLGIGAPCNVCEVKDPFGTIASLNLDWSDFRVEARGIRNTVGFDWNPSDNTLWFSENGRDMMGDDIPRDELNHITSDSPHFGYPYCHESDVLDPGFGKGQDCNDYVAPAISLSPHAAALGIKFVGSKLYIAEHGSWNRKTPIGYRVMSVDVSGNGASNYQVVVDGWLGSNGKAVGRPVDILVFDEKTLLISDDFAGAIYALSIK